MVPRIARRAVVAAVVSLQAPALEKLVREPAPEESCAAGDQNFHCNILRCYPKPNGCRALQPGLRARTRFLNALARTSDSHT